MNINNSFVLVRLDLWQRHLDGERSILRHAGAQQLGLKSIGQYVLARVFAMDLVAARVVYVHGMHFECVVVDYFDAEVLGLVSGEVKRELELLAIVGLIDQAAGVRVRAVQTVLCGGGGGQR